VPIGYLVSATLLAWCTLCALAPWRRLGLLGSVGFYFGFIVNEVPCLVVYWLVAATLLAFAQGDIGSPVGLVALGLTVSAIAGLVVVAWRAKRTGPVIERALDDGLGAGWPAGIDEPLAAGLRPTFSVRPVLFCPSFARRRDVERVANISYGDAGVRNLMDVYRHRSRPVGCPVLIHLHGGRLERGRKNRQALPLIYRLASRGWLCISANYRLRPDATFPDHLIDVKKVLAWVRAEGESYGADPTVVFVAGSSSGGQLAALAALTPNDPRYQPGFETADTSVLAAISLYGVLGWPGSQSDTFPLAQVRADAPAFFVAHGDRDSLVPVETARGFVDALREVSTRPVVYAELPGGQHGFDTFRSVRCDNVVNGIESFAAWVRSTAR
jgi:acetyl esterase/lipase